MHRKNWLVVVILFLLLPVAIGLYLRAQTPKSPEYISPSNIHSRLEDYAFSSSRVDYRLPKSFWNGRIVNKLPTSIRNLLPKPSSAMWNTCVPFFPNEAILSCAFSIKVPDNVQVGALRIVTADELGNEFDPVGQSANVNGNNPYYFASEVTAFPRRGKTVQLMLKQNGDTIAQFQIQNPAARSYPQWNPVPLPVVTSSNDLRIALADFKTQFEKEYSGMTHFPSTVCAFQTEEREGPSTNWLARTAEVSDATGNHWEVMFDKRYEHAEGNTHSYGFLGALWAGEEAWKLNVRFEKQSGFADAEVVTFKDLPVPTGEEILRPKTVIERDDARLEILALLGPRVKHEGVESLSPNIWPQAGTLMIVLNGSLRANGRSFAVVSLIDDTGAPIQLETPPGQPLSVRSERDVPYTIKFRSNPESPKLSLTVAIPKIQQREFIAKPRRE